MQCDIKHTRKHKAAPDLRLEIVNYLWILHLVGLELWKGFRSPSQVCFSFQNICSLMEHAVIKSFSCGRMNKQTCCKPILVKLINPIVQFICFVSYPTPPPPSRHQCHPLGALPPPHSAPSSHRFSLAIQTYCLTTCSPRCPVTACRHWEVVFWVRAASYAWLWRKRRASAIGLSDRQSGRCLG